MAVLQHAAEIMSIGDEIVSGQRLDTNTQWLSAALGNLGIPVRFHTTVGDELDDHVAALRVAIQRVEVLILTGGLGPTADDLTRQAVAIATERPLEFVPSVMQSIEAIFLRSGRTMPDNNRLQAMFPIGSTIIPNPEGTAPGIDLTVPRESSIDRMLSGEISECRIFCLPGVPAEMKQMWQATVEPALRLLASEHSLIHHHTLHCFGAGESTIESMLPDLIRRDREPRVGITASSATISLRISTPGKSVEDCLSKMQPTIDSIRDCLGDLVFGENNQTLDEVVFQMLQQKHQTIAIFDAGFQGEVARLLMSHGGPNPVVTFSQTTTQEIDSDQLPTAEEIRKDADATWGLVIGPIQKADRSLEEAPTFFEVVLSNPQQEFRETFRYGGHSDWRQQRGVKQVLNFVRLNLERGLPLVPEQS